MQRRANAKNSSAVNQQATTFPEKFHVNQNVSRKGRTHQITKGLIHEVGVPDNQLVTSSN